MVTVLRSMQALALVGCDPRIFPRTPHYLQRCRERGFDDTQLVVFLNDAVLADITQDARYIYEGELGGRRWRVILADDSHALITVVALGA